MEHSRFGRKGGCFRDFREDLRRQSLEAPPRRNLHAQLHMGGMTQRLPLKKNEHVYCHRRRIHRHDWQSFMGCIIIWKRYTTCMEMKDETRGRLEFSPMRAREFFALYFHVKWFSLSFSFEFYLLHSSTFQKLVWRHPVVYRWKPYVRAEFAGVILKKKVLSRNEWETNWNLCGFGF